MPCSYGLCTEDALLPPATQREMAARLGVGRASDHATLTLRSRELAPLVG